jgi:hypothetical protein
MWKVDFVSVEHEQPQLFMQSRGGGLKSIGAILCIKASTQILLYAQSKDFGGENRCQHPHLPFFHERSMGVTLNGESSTLTCVGWN